MTSNGPDPAVQTLPDAALSDAVQPIAAQPDAAQPDAAQPDAAQPDAAQPDAAQPDAAQPDATLPAGSESVLQIRQIGLDSLAEIFAPHTLQIVLVADAEPIPGSHWGEPEAGLIGHNLYVRHDTPVHSALHEGCHWLLMSAVRRSQLHTDAKGTQAEEMAVCYLQVRLADRIPGMGRERMWRDMDAWGYNFMLGSARRWFEEDTADALCTLEAHWHRWPGLLGAGVEP